MDSCAAWVGAIAASIYTAGFIVDMQRRHKVRSVSFVQVPNKNEGGVDEFSIAGFDVGVNKAEKILIYADNSVEIHQGGRARRYSKFIHWLAEAPGKPGAPKV